MTSSQPPLLDLSALEALAGTIEELRYFAELWFTQTQKDIKRLEAHREEGDSHEWVSAAHTLKGAAATLGAERLRAVCERAQFMNPATKDARDAVYAEVQTGIEEVTALLRRKELLK